MKQKCILLGKYILYDWEEYNAELLHYVGAGPLLMNRTDRSSTIAHANFLALPSLDLSSTTSHSVGEALSG